MKGKITILLVEDNLEHLHLTRHILERNGVEEEFRVARDGQEALDYLYQRERFQDRLKNPRPALVLLDLNIPRIDGKEVLRRMKQDPSLSDIPVVVVSSSTRPEDVAFAKEQGASAYFSKSAGFEKLSEQLATIGQFITGRDHP